MHALTGGVTIVLAGLGNRVADIGALAQVMPPEWVRGAGDGAVEELKVGVMRFAHYAPGPASGPALAFSPADRFVRVVQNALDDQRTLNARQASSCYLSQRVHVQYFLGIGIRYALMLLSFCFGISVFRLFVRCAHVSSSVINFRDTGMPMWHAGRHG